MSAARLPLKNLFSKFDFEPTRQLADQIIRWKLLYETRDQHAEALNTPLLGCSKMGFFPKDSQALFDILGVNKEEFKQAIRQSTVNNDFKVASDEFNLLTVYAAHVFFTSSLPQPVRENVTKALFFMMLVKFFSSLMKHYLPYGAKKGVMELTIDSLSDKFDIKQKETSTWKLVMEARAQELIQPGNIHWNALRTFIPDQKVVYIITDLQTRIRTKIRLIMSIYFDMVKNEREIRETGMVDVNDEGEKEIVKELGNSFANMIASVCNRVLNTSQFIRSDYIRLLSKKVPNVREDTLREVLMKFSSMATLQYQKKQGDLMSKDGKTFVGYHILIMNLIQRTYRACIMDKTCNIKSRLEIFNKTMNMYRSSRINDPIVLQVKESVDKFITDGKFSSRDATNASLKISLIVYIILMTFDCD